MTEKLRWMQTLLHMEVHFATNFTTPHKLLPTGMHSLANVGSTCPVQSTAPKHLHSSWRGCPVTSTCANHLSKRTAHQGLPLLPGVP